VKLALNPIGTWRRVAGASLMALGAIAFTAPAHAEDGVIRIQFGNWKSITGSGKLGSETRAVSGFQAIALRGSMNVVLHQGTREGVELRADDNLLPLIETQVVDRDGVRTLEIGTKKDARYSSRNPVIANVDLISLQALAVTGSGDVLGDALKTSSLKVAITGSGDVKLRQLAADEVSIKISGSGDIEFSGRTGKLGVSIAGSGDVNTRGLDADDVSVSVAGSGDANVAARKTLSVSIAGSGSVVYTGDAAVKSSIAGSGSVTKQ
jgi:Putative auto-transporter adhesin, head GIN domain